MTPLPRLRRVVQCYPERDSLDVRAAVAAACGAFRARIRPGARIAVGVGSRGIAGLADMVGALVGFLREAGAQPFLIPTMGSHGGATPEGQKAILAGYGVTEEALGVPIRASLETRRIGTSAEGVPVHCSVEALAADGILLLNRVKPHTDFRSVSVGSGLLKMAVIGLGKRDGATAMHGAAMRIGYEEAIRGIARVITGGTPLLGGLAVIEDQRHRTARIEAVTAAEFEAREPALLAEARALMPSLPFDEIDLLIVDRIGKDVSGVGMDPNVTGRWVHGYSSSLVREGRPSPFIRRIAVLGLTPGTRGNAIGIGLADFTTERLIRAVDRRATAVNALTALTPQCAKLPIAFANDRELLAQALVTLALPPGAEPRIVRVADTLSVAEMDVSEALWGDVASRPGLAFAGEGREPAFDADGNLTDA